MGQVDLSVVDASGGSAKPATGIATMRVETLITAYVLSLLAALSSVAIYFHLRRKRFEPEPSEDNVFRCEKCAFVYTDDSDVDRSRCPQCGTVNATFRF